MQNDIYWTQPLMETLFPDMRGHKESMALSLLGDGFGTKNIISVLIRPSRDGVECFRNSCGKYDTKSTCYIITENGANRLGCRLEFPFKERVLGFEGLIDPRDPVQKQIVSVLKINNEIMIWVADNECRVVKVIRMGWDYDAHKEVLDRF